MPFGGPRRHPRDSAVTPAGDRSASDPAHPWRHGDAVAIAVVAVAVAATDRDHGLEVDLVGHGLGLELDVHVAGTGLGGDGQVLALGRPHHHVGHLALPDAAHALHL